MMDSASLVVIIPGFRPTVFPFSVAIRHQRLAETLRTRLLRKGHYDFAVYDWQRNTAVVADAAESTASFAKIVGQSFLGAAAAAFGALAPLPLGIGPLPAASVLLALRPLKRDFLRQQIQARAAGNLLRDRIVDWAIQRDLRGRYHYESVVVVGFSLGCAVLNSAFEVGLGQEGYASHRIAKCFYIAPAVPRDQPPTTTLPVRTFYSRRDAILRWLYPRATGCEAAGYHGFVLRPNIENFHHRVGHLEHGDPDGTAAFITAMI